MSFLAVLRRSKKFSERSLAEAAEVSRATLRSYENNLSSSKVEILGRIANALEHQIILAVVPYSPAVSDFSTVGVSAATVADGFQSWKIHFFNFVDHFRKTKDFRLVILPPVSNLDPKLQSLMAAIVCVLCQEVDLDPPDWASLELFLDKPWFVSEMESLKASAILESPLPFRRNNIFVNENFLQRA